MGRRPWYDRYDWVFYIVASVLAAAFLIRAWPAIERHGDRIVQDHLRQQEAIVSGKSR